MRNFLLLISLIVFCLVTIGCNRATPTRDERLTIFYSKIVAIQEVKTDNNLWQVDDIRTIGTRVPPSYLCADDSGVITLLVISYNETDVEHYVWVRGKIDPFTVSDERLVFHQDSFSMIRASMKTNIDGTTRFRINEIFREIVKISKPSKAEK